MGFFFKEGKWKLNPKKCEVLEMIEKILPNLYRMEIPLPKSPLKSLNSYLIKGDGRFLIIDTGMNREECLTPMLSYLEKLDVDLGRTDFFITHLHADHLGLVGNLATDFSKVYFSEKEAQVVGSENRSPKERFEEFFKFYIKNGFPEEELKLAFQNHPGYRYSPKGKIEFSVLRDGDSISIGEFSFRCIETPGHSPGHMCLYEEEKKILIAGDHILFDITPNITYWPELGNSLKRYLSSLDKVYPLEIELVLPGHRNFWNNHKKRIEELKEHHKRRLNEVIVALENGEKSSWEVAPFITWDIDVSSWEFFPSVQKWFAVGETIAHLIYLEKEGKIVKREEENRIIFSIR
jgi:glyoxylase-like metal-dependent hydrolase (beta-lactamase superfamily II)